MAKIDLSTLTLQCAFKGCEEHYRQRDGQPAGWTHLVMYAAPKAVLDLSKIKHWVRDAVLCPAHSAIIDGQLVDLSTAKRVQ